MKFDHPLTLISELPNLFKPGKKPGKIGLKSWFDQLQVGAKIAIGYILSLGITISGTTAGIIMSNRYQNYVQAMREDVLEEIHLLSDIQVNFMHVIMLQQAITKSLENPDKFQHEYQKMKAYESRLHQSWIALKQSYEEPEVDERNDEIELMNLLIQEYQENVPAYFDSFHRSLQQLESGNLTDNQSQNNQEIILNLRTHYFQKKFEEISGILSQLSEALFLEEKETEEQFIQANVIYNTIIFFSIFISTLIALFLSIYTTKILSNPIQELTKAAKKAAQESDFELQVEVKNQDEIGSLTKSFNQLISQVKVLLEEQKKSAQDQLIQHEKLSSLGQMVAGIAHEINNPVSCISGNINYLIEYTDHLLELIHTYQHEISDPPTAVLKKVEAIELDYIEADLPNLLQAIQVSAERTQQIAVSLRNFSRLDEAKPQTIDIHECLDSSLLILKSRIKQGITIEKRYGDLPCVEAYFSSLSQVFINLINNAIDALIEQRNSGPILTITTECLDSEQIIVRFADNGPGISSENQQKIFDTFFTTKPVNVGTGLGLSISHQIVEQKHHGSLKCQSKLGEGTEFWVILPIQQSFQTVQAA